MSVSEGSYKGMSAGLEGRRRKAHPVSQVVKLQRLMCADFKV
jgi:hypothetical protein